MTETRIVKRRYVFDHWDDFQIRLELGEDGCYFAVVHIPSTNVTIDQGKYGIEAWLNRLSGEGWTLTEPAKSDKDKILEGLRLDFRLSDQPTKYPGETGLEDW
jgi:hypothetical protein